MKKIVLLLILMIPVLLSATVIPAGDVSGIWDVAGSPYYIDGEITIQSGEELQIEPGVDVIFNAHYKFNIFGRIVANGTANDSIKFMPLDSNIGWHGLRFIDGYLSSLPASEISYCQLKRGFALGADPDSNGGAIYCTNTSNLTIDNCFFAFNYCEWDGGAIFLGDGSDVAISNSMFLENDCGFYGAGIIAYSSDPVVDKCTFKSNSSSVFGAGFSAWDGSSPEIYNSWFIDNSAGACTGIYCVDSNVKMANLIMFNNSTDFGSGAAIGITNCSTEASNITAVDNESLLSGGAFWVNAGDLQLYNSILWNNLPEDIFVLSGTAEVYNSCVSDGTTGTGVISDDPQFVDLAGYDLHLSEASPCIDSGDDTIVPFTIPLYDLDGNDRIIDGDLSGTLEIDMGVYEFVPAGPTTGFIAGNVTEIDGDPLENAEITAGTYTANTDVNGDYSMEVDAGDYTVSCHLDGYLDPDDVDVTVIAGETVTVDFVLELESGAGNILSITHLTLLGNRPNPFNPSTIISFAIPKEEMVNVTIYNSKGQFFHNLVSSTFSAGIHQVEWNGLDENNKIATSGIYFYKIQTGNESTTGKMMLIK